MNLTQFMKLHPLPMKPATQGDVIPEAATKILIAGLCTAVL